MGRCENVARPCTVADGTMQVNAGWLFVRSVMPGKGGLPDWGTGHASDERALGPFGRRGEGGVADGCSALRARRPCGCAALPSLWDRACGPPAVLLSADLLIKGRVPHPLAAWLIPNGTRGALRPAAGAEVGNGARAGGACLAAARQSDGGGYGWRLSAKQIIDIRGVNHFRYFFRVGNFYICHMLASLTH